MTPYYERGGITIYHGDCRDVTAELSALARAGARIADVVITDPPYGVGLTAKRAKQRGGGVKVRPGEYSFDDTPEYVSGVVVPVIQAFREVVPAVVVTPGTRNLWLYPPADDVGCFFSAAGTGMGRWGFTCSQPILFYGDDPYLSASLGSRPNSHGQSYPNDANEIDHPCAKPLPMWRWLVARASLDGHVIIDPFMGSGTTLVAAKHLNRKAIGIEIEERYCEIAADRLRQEVMNLA